MDTGNFVLKLGKLVSLGRLSLLAGRGYIQCPRLHHKTRVNQRASRERGCQVRFSGEVAAGIASNIVVDSCPLHDRLDGDFLEAVLLGMLNSTCEEECAFSSRRTCNTQWGIKTGHRDLLRGLLDCRI